MFNEEKLGYSLAELAEQLPLSVPFLRKEIREGRLKCRKFGDRVIVLKEDRDAYVFGRSHGESGDESRN